MGKRGFCYPKRKNEGQQKTEKLLLTTVVNSAIISLTILVNEIFISKEVSKCFQNF